MQTTIIVATHKPYWVPDDPMYLPVQMGHAVHPACGYIGDDTGDNISERNANFCELTGLYWAAHNIDSDYIGIVHYRRYFASRRKSRFADKKSRVISHEELCSILATTNVVLPKERHYFIETNYTQYIHAHHKQDLEVTRAIIARKCPEYLPAYDLYMSKTHGHHFNMFVMKKELLQHYCTWLFDILFELERELDMTGYTVNDRRVFGFVSERLLDAWLTTNNISFEELSIVYMEHQNWLRKGTAFLKRKFFPKKMLDARNVTAIVVTYNRLPLLKQCLAALRAQTVQGFTVLLVDNASTDGTADYIKTLAMPGLVCRNPGENLGGAGGFAYGIRAAVELGCEAVWIMDDDTLPEPDALAALLAADAAHGDGCGWLSSRALAPDGTDQPMNLQRKTMYRDIDGFDAAEVPAVMASFVSLFLRTEAVRQFGLPIAEFFIWSDDWEYTRRISRAKPCYVIPASRVVHAMQNPGVVNIARDVPARWARYRYFYRNDVVLYRREGLSGWLWLLAKDSWHTVQVLRDRQGCRAERIKIIWKGFAAGVRFRPQIPYLP